MKKILPVIAVVIICAAAFMGYKMFSPPPDDLDLATTRTTMAGHFVVTVVPEKSDFKRNTIHSWIAEIKTPSGTPIMDAKIAIDGGMPTHGHGLPTDPQMTENLGEGRYKIDGVRFNMRGWWELKLSISSGDLNDTITFNLVF